VEGFVPLRFNGGSGGNGYGINALKGSGDREFVIYLPATLTLAIVHHLQALFLFKSPHK